MKQVEEVFTTVSEDKRFYIQTGDGDRYVFFFLPWHDKPLFSHRYSPDDEKRDFTNQLPTKVRQIVENKFGGYFRQLLSEHER